LKKICCFFCAYFCIAIIGLKEKIEKQRPALEELPLPAVVVVKEKSLQEAGKQGRCWCGTGGKEKFLKKWAKGSPATVVLVEGKTSLRNFQNRRFPILPTVLIVKEAEGGKSAEVTEQDSTTVPKFAVRSFSHRGNLVGECLPQTLLYRPTPERSHR